LEIWYSEDKYFSNMANDGFTRKKVESLTLGEKLKKLRGDFRMSLSEISKSDRGSR